MSIALHFHGEIVNCDSLQLYRGFDIGTAKTPVTERAGIPHHLFDVLQPEQTYSAGEYARSARSVLQDISDRGQLPVIAGGTGFYLRALFRGLPELPDRNEELRARLSAREFRRPGCLHRILRRLEPAAAKRIHSNDTQKTMRALEIRLLTNATVPPREHALPLSGYAEIRIGLYPDRSALRERLDARTRIMFEKGLTQEVQHMLDAGTTGREKPFESLGYKQALRYLHGELTREQAIESTQIETRQYAKRQLTWFRGDPEIHWLAGFGDSEETMTEAIAFVAGKLTDPNPEEIEKKGTR